MRKATHFALMPIEDPKAFEKLMVECATVKYGKRFSLIGRIGQPHCFFTGINPTAPKSA